MYKKDGRWWMVINGVPTSVGSGTRLELLICAARGALRRLLAPLFCIICGHTYTSQGFGYRCSVCEQEY